MGSKEYRVSLNNWKANADAKIDALARGSTLALAEEVHATTPRDTGTLAASWQPSIGEPAPPAEVQTSMTIIAATIAGMKPGDRFHMVTHLDYAWRQEAGFVGEDSLGRTYDQKGKFFVQRAVKRWLILASKVAADLGMTKG